MRIAVIQSSLKSNWFSVTMRRWSNLTRTQEKLECKTCCQGNTMRAWSFRANRSPSPKDYGSLNLEAPSRNGNTWHILRSGHRLRKRLGHENLRIVKFHSLLRKFQRNGTTRHTSWKPWNETSFSYRLSGDRLAKQNSQGSETISMKSKL